ncbi:hypothetical protein B0H34DRAFT_684715 [Crassisporium funariophilum]|nr:hypothetical protein B0H34DRAFT_684715 [Crassisporium funariophilum]
MAERSVSRPWSEDEDSQLRRAVGLYGENDNWKNIAEQVPGRTNKACRKRWLHSLQPNVKKSAWTPSEDTLLMELRHNLGPKWSTIARQIFGRTDDACSKRYREALDPSLKKDDWTPEEDEKLMQAYNRVGGKWGQVGQELQRSGLGCRNRWRLLERKKTLRSSLSIGSSGVNDPSTPLESPVLGNEHLQDEYLQDEHSQDTFHEVQWPPYYPPEAYPTFPNDNHPHNEYGFREPTPEALDVPDPHIAPFQYSSSSLSAALSDPPRPPPPLPPFCDDNTPELVIQDYLNDSDRQPSLSPLSQCNGMSEINDVLMLPDDSYKDRQEMEKSISQLPFESEQFNSFGHPADYGSYYSASPIIVSPENTRTLDPYHFDMWKPRNMEYDFDSSPSSVFGLPLPNDGPDDQSSTSSTPYVFSSSLSPTTSPIPLSTLDLTTNEQLSSNSLLFSVESRREPVRRPRKVTTKKRASKPSIKSAVNARLSSLLSLSADPNVKPYACGRVNCWPSGETTSLHCFATSAALVEHSKEEHPDDHLSDKRYRCALPACGKSWKSINGLQYHLQISTEHFQNALYSRFSAQQPSTSVLNTPSSLNTEAETEEIEPERNYPCPESGCYKAYRQPSGLRYHIKHGHPPDMPAQLAIVPPALERQIPTKARKLRPKPPPKPIISCEVSPPF